MLAIRVPFAIVAGALFSVAIFLGLWQLVSVPFDAPPLEEAVRIEFKPQLPSTTPTSLREPKIERVPPVLEPDRPRLQGGSDRGQVTGYVRPTLQPIVKTDGPRVQGLDGDVVPIVRATPEYPPAAIAKGTEGWVQVQFTVTAVGTVRDAVVVASEPGTVFDAAALKTIARWRYNPKVEHGEPVARVGLQTVIRFRLDN